MTDTNSAIDAMKTRTWPFFLLTLGFTLIVQSPAVLVRYGVLHGEVNDFMGLVALGALGPMIVGLLLSRGQRGGARAVMRSLLAWQVAPYWYPVALFGLAGVYIVGRGTYGLFVSTDLPWLYPPSKPEYVIAMFMFPIVEEIGWRGYALPRLQLRYGALTASLLLGIGWALWHTMMFLVSSSSPLVFLVGCVNIVVGSFTFTWLYNRTQGSLLLALLLHMGAHIHNPSHAVPDITPLLVQTVALAVVMAVLVVVDRRAWSQPLPALPGERPAL